MPDTEQITIAGRAFTVPNPYKEGHQCSAGEAGALNQVFHENIRNNLAKKLPEDNGEAQGTVDEYAAKYEFGVRSGGGGGGGPRDPVKVEAMRIARDQVRVAIQKAGLKIDDFTSKDISERAASELEKHPAWTEEAKRRVSAQRELANVELPIDKAA